MNRWLPTLLAPLLAACSSAPPTRTVDTPNGACADYPAGAVRPMELGSVIFPYSWTQTRHLGTGSEAPIDLGQVPCATDPDIDWSPFDVLLFVSIPAW
jgi:hypothetical protein